MDHARRPGVPGSLGRVLGPGGDPAGTCFQVTPGLLVTARHVLEGLGRGAAGQEVAVDALDGSAGPAPATVAAVDAVGDLAVLRRAEPLAESVPGWVPTDSVPPGTKVVVSGVAEVDDPGHRYEFLQATGEWQGATERDGVALGRLSCSAVLTGMSGAPVLRGDDGRVVGVVSERYHSAGGWLRDTVWVARTEDLTRLLTAHGQVTVRQRLVLGDTVGIELSADGGGPAPAPLAPVPAAGPAEAAREAEVVLAALDGSCRGTGPFVGLVDLLATRMAAGGWSTEVIEDLRRRLRSHGLEPAALLPRLPDHDEAVRQWSRPFPGGSGEVTGHVARALLTGVRRTLAGALRDGVLVGIAGSCRGYLLEALEDGDALPLSGFLHALSARLPAPRSAAVEAVWLPGRGPAGNGPGERTTAGPSGPGRRAIGHGRPAERPGLVSVAAQMCRLPLADPCTAGRAAQVAGIVSKIDRNMTRYGSATAFLSGQPGVGTSVVAVEAARALAPAFPGGVFYVDLQGLVPDACLSVRTVVRIVSEALGLDADVSLRDDARTIASFLARLHDRRVLLVLDNARDAAHVRPLVKAPAGCAVVVTSRNRAQDYAGPGLTFEVGRLDREASVEVLRRCAQDSGSGSPDGGTSAELHRLAHLCDDVPLALRIVGARLAQPSGGDPAYLRHLLEEARLDTLSWGDRAVRLAIRLSHDTLDPPARRVLRLITAAPGSAVTGAELGHCLRQPALRQELMLNRLVDHSLAHQDLVRMPEGGLLATFRLFDLVRLFAAERLELEEDSDVVRAFQRDSVSYLCERLTEITDQTSGAQLSGELDPSRFHAAQRLAAANGWLDLATDLAVGLHVLYSARGELDAVVAVNEDRIGLLLRQGQPAQAVKACLLNAETLRSADAAGPAADAARQAVRLAREYRLDEDAAEAEFQLSLALWDLADRAGALAAGERAVALLESAGRPSAAVPLTINNSRLARHLGDTEKALRWGRRAVELADRWSTGTHRAMARNQCGLAEEDAGGHAAALALYQDAAGLWEAVGNTSNAANEHSNAGYTARRLDDPVTASHQFHRAAHLWQRAEEHLRALEALVDLSAVHASQDSWKHAHRVLAEAEEAALGPARDAPALLRGEVSVRRAASCLWATGEVPDSYRTRAETEGDEPPELEEARAALDRFRSGESAVGEARRQVGPLLRALTFNKVPRADPWMYETMGGEAPDRPVLET
ncbi:trypsin-like peptidase domain-containing protein [Streptomyces sp. ISL-12]|uniref:S1 family peptidase n=1 Tax=Streptomyces sp. ISL-12 TaxID=2819177 RepID=UPI001BE8DF02|nr:serine protease [Streptomyces sp. ISL-12]MBT2414208.1 trypsin-like peptidase domain-containing protein [Streptomyces sp. ISL-12]